MQARTFANQQKRRSTKSNKNSASREINANIVDLGKKHKWKDLLQVHKKDKIKFNHVNYSTIMSQLARIRNLDTRDTIDCVLSKIARILHYLSMPLRSLTLQHPNSRNAHWLLLNGKQQDIANSVWAFATLGVKAPKLFEGLDHESDRLVRDGTPQAISNSLCLCNPWSESAEVVRGVGSTE